MSIGFLMPGKDIKKLLIDAFLLINASDEEGELFYKAPLTVLPW
jgi:hypothetical protein